MNSDDFFVLLLTDQRPKETLYGRVWSSNFDHQNDYDAKDDYKGHDRNQNPRIYSCSRWQVFQKSGYCFDTWIHRFQVCQNILSKRRRQNRIRSDHCHVLVKTVSILEEFVHASSDIRDIEWNQMSSGATTLKNTN